MQQSIQQNATRANARTAGVAAAIVAGVMVVQAVVGSIISFFGNLGYGAGNGDMFGGLDAYNPLVGMFQQLTTSVLPIAAGVFLAFWLVVPITADLPLARVIVRSLVAAAIASAVSLVISVVFALATAVSTAGPLFGNSFPVPDGGSLFFSLVGSIQSVAYTFLSTTPLIVLAGVLVWLWLSKRESQAGSN
jgi:hypothetical protein